MIPYSKKGCCCMKKKTIIILVIIAVLILGLLLRDNLIQLYVKTAHNHLETYAAKCLDSGTEKCKSYGLWDVRIHPDDHMVEFWTGGFGLAPSSTYKGFYYCADNTHKPFSITYEDTVTMQIDGDHATWTDGTDNHGSSVRIIDKWFWFEASF